MLSVAATVATAAVALALLMLGAGTGVAGSGHHKRAKVPRTFFGLLPGPAPLDGKDISRIARIKVRTVRIGLNWASVQPQQSGGFNWSVTDRQIGSLAAKGVHVLPNLAGTPRWVSSEATTPPVGSQQDGEAWQNFVGAAVRRYGPGGSFWGSPFHAQCGCDARPVPIKEWQIWNEPNLKHYFTPKPSPSKYAKLVKLSRPAIEQADPKAKLILAGLSGGGKPSDIAAIPYLKRFYRVKGIKASFDAAALHPYAHNVSDLRSLIAQFRKVMKKRHDKRTGLWLTEHGYGSAHPDKFGLNKGMRGQKRMLEKTYRLLLDRRKAWKIERVFWFFWRDPPKSNTDVACSFCTSAGLLKNNRKPKPAYKPFKRLTRRAG